MKQPQAADPGSVLCHILFCGHSATFLDENGQKAGGILGTSSFHYLRQFIELTKIQSIYMKDS